MRKVAERVPRHASGTERGQSSSTAVERYGAALLLVLLALILWHLGVYRVGLSPFFLYLVAVTVASWFGGFGPGVVAIVAGVIASNFAYAFPGYFVLEWPRGALQLALFLFVSVTITLLHEERMRLLAGERSSRQRTERLMAEQTAMLEQMSDAVVIANAQGQITYLNEAAKRIFAASDLQGIFVQGISEWVRILRPNGGDVSEEDFALARAARGETITDLQRVLERPDGSRVWIVASARQVRGPEGAVLGAIATVRDVTAERELEHQREMLLSTVVHDLKSPLATIKGVAQLLKRRLSHSPEIPSSLAQDMTTGLQDIDGKVTQMVTLINELVEVGRGNRALELNLGAVDLVDLVRRTAQVMARGAEDHDIRVEARVSQLVGYWDVVRLQRVIENLLSNAIKYSPQGGVITVSLDCECSGEGDEARIVISDSGIGIPRHDQARIFEQFYRADNAAEIASGTGIGLAAVKQIVEGHGGCITIESTEGHGTTVRVRLPIEEREREQRRDFAGRPGAHHPG